MPAPKATFFAMSAFLPFPYAVPVIQPAALPSLRLPSAAPTLSVVIPACNEAANLPALLREVVAALDAGEHYEVLVVDDASTDDSAEVLLALQATLPQLRVLRHAIRSGQSTAIRNGVASARGLWIATLDGDGQNDPADLPALLALRDGDAGTKLFAGWRTTRKDTGSRRWASRAANAIRGRLLGDATPDTGCGTKLFERAAFLQLPYFDHMHRYLPALFQAAGWATQSVPVNHRPRAHGTSNYSNLQRALVGIVDLVGVLWLRRRTRVTPVEECG